MILLSTSLTTGRSHFSSGAFATSERRSILSTLAVQTLSIVAAMILNFSLSTAQASPIDLTPHGKPTPAPASTKAMAEVEVTHPHGAQPGAKATDSIDSQAGVPVVFPDFQNVRGSSARANASANSNREGASQTVCHRDGRTYKPDDAMFASCTSQNEVERAVPKASQGKSRGASTGSDMGSF